jgi:hypothetical protein
MGPRGLWVFLGGVTTLGQSGVLMGFMGLFRKEEETEERGF